MSATKFDRAEFDRWMVEVDRKVARRIGFGTNDLRDFCYADWYESGLTSSEAALEVLDEIREEW
jgi:hypothetical protein